MAQNCLTLLSLVAAASVAHATIVRNGNCPPADVRTTPADAKHTACSSDADCPGNLKCCPTLSASRLCMAPVFYQLHGADQKELRKSLADVPLARRKMLYAELRLAHRKLMPAGSTDPKPAAAKGQQQPETTTTTAAKGGGPGEPSQSSAGPFGPIVSSHLDSTMVPFQPLFQPMIPPFQPIFPPFPPLLPPFQPMVDEPFPPLPSPPRQEPFDAEDLLEALEPIFDRLPLQPLTLEPLINEFGNPGSCPPLFLPIVGPALHCSNDFDCVMNFKCCYTVNGQQCVRALRNPSEPLPKRGQCPRPSGPRIPGRWTDRCLFDNQCGLFDKCCLTPFGTRCTTPLGNLADVNYQIRYYTPGHCPASESTNAIASDDLCNADEDCPIGWKCCAGRYGRQCRLPVENA